MNLIIICIIYMLLTFYLFKKTLNDKLILLFMLLGQIILILGSIINNDIIIEISHIIYFISIFLGLLFFEDFINNIFILFLLFITLLTRWFFDDCLFSIVNNNTEIINLNNLNIDYGLIYKLSLFFIILKIILKN